MKKAASSNPKRLPRYVPIRTPPTTHTLTSPNALGLSPSR